MAALESEFNANLVSFIGSPDMILSWDYPNLSCPVAAPDTLCEYVGILDQIFIQNKYCSAKYDITEISSCNADAFCNIGTTTACELSNEAKKTVQDQALQVRYCSLAQ